MTDEQTFADYRSRINIKEVLEDAGYTFYKRDGLRYPAYVGLDNNGQRIRGNKFIVMPNKNCCFQPPQIKLYSVTSFIWEHPQLFDEYEFGMKESALVHKVCQRLLNIQVEHIRIGSSRIQLLVTNHLISRNIRLNVSILKISSHRSHSMLFSSQEA